MTYDVEDFSIPLNRCDPDMAKQVYNEGLPMIIDILSKHDIKNTFYFTGEMCENIPESVDLIKEHGHEIGCHGYTHSLDRSFDILSYEDQLKDLQKAKRIIEDVAGRIESFRSPALRINKDTIKALEKTGFTSDSSVCSQRFDGPLTFGSKNKLKWLFAPRKPYFLSHKSIIKKGNSKILEIPISAAIFPYIGTTMRVSPTLTKILQRFLFFESKHTNKPIVFLFHPNECLDIGNEIVTTRRSHNLVEYVFADIIRHRLKLKNLGKLSLKLMSNILNSAKQYGFEFISIKEYRKLYKNENTSKSDSSSTCTFL